MYKLIVTIFVSVILFVCGHVQALAQETGLPGNFSLQVNGNIRFADSKMPAENALVRIESFTGGLVGQLNTDRTGKFTFNRLNPIQYIVSVHVPGYIDAREDVNLVTSPTAYLNILLQRDKTSLVNRDGNSIPLLSPEAININVPPGAQQEYAKGKAIVDEGKKEKLGEAVKHFELAIAAYPQYLDAQLLLGLTYMDLEQWEKAEKALLAASTLNDQASTVYFALGEAYRREKKYNDGEKALLAGLKLNSDSAEGHTALAKLYWDMAPSAPDEQAFRARLQSSWNEVDKALKIKPAQADAQLLAGNLLLKARRAEAALPHFEEYLRLEPNGAFAADTRSLVEKIKQALAQAGKR